jgi:hypothetical protein
MKPCKPWLLALCLFLPVLAASAGETLRLQARLIAADKLPGDSDPALEPILPHLENFPFRRYRQVGSRTVSLDVGKKQWIRLGDGHVMLIRVVAVDGREARMEVSWRKDDREVADITVVSRPGAPFVLGGPSAGPTTYIAVFTRRDL